MTQDSVQSVIFGFGHRARHGKDTVAAAIKTARGNRRPYDIRIYGFAGELKKEALENFLGKRKDYWEYLDEHRNSAISSFMSRVEIYDEGCWLWKGALAEKGYGRVYTPEKPNYKAHRFMWEQILGNEPVELLRHTCDVRHCVNPLHLLPGTLQDNSKDMVDRVRFSHGEDHPNATLSDTEIQHILDLYFYWDMTQAEISTAFQVSSATVSRIVTGSTRKIYTVPAAFPETIFSRQWLDDEHKPKFRCLLQNLGTEYRRAVNENYWVNRLAQRLAEEKPEIAFITDMRFLNEVAFVKKYGEIIKVYRPGLASPNSHISEEALVHLRDDEWGAVIVNDGTLEELKAKAVQTFDRLMEERP